MKPISIRIKICGITQVDDGLAASRYGADALGLVFYRGSPRSINIDQAQRIIRPLPPFISTVALFVNPNEAEVNHILANVPIDLLQFHGDETAEFCQQFHRPYIKAVRVQNNNDIMQAQQNHPFARALLFDTYHPTQYGGTGQTFNWQMLPEKMDFPWILAGGLNPVNIAQAIHLTHPLAVDVSGGVERSKGIKDHTKIKQFIEEINIAQQQLTR